ncbi:MAG: MATE family efflux transporter, partial [Gemmatimonadetes bacterium]|nr:MATE family efflux transporter [Gemmatimonadota bacterium]
ANAVILQVWGLTSFAVDGFAHAAETLVGRCLGAHLFVEARQFAWRIICWGVGLGAGFGLAYFAALEPIAALFTPHREVVQQVGALYVLIALLQPLNAVVFVFDGIFIGASDMGYLFKAMALATFGVFLPSALVFIYWLDWELVGAWMAYSGLMVGRFVTLWPRYRGDAWLRSFVE